MKRSAPMRRTGFKRPKIEFADPPHSRIQGGIDTLAVSRQPAGECGHDTPRRSRGTDRHGTFHRGTYTSTAGVAQPKRGEVRSESLLGVARILGRCAFCMRWTKTEPCHSNWAIHGKAKGQKADDNRIAAGCRDCHRELDQGKTMTLLERQLKWWEAHVRTVEWVIARGAWPKGVPVPEVAHNPFA